MTAASIRVSRLCSLGILLVTVVLALSALAFDKKGASGFIGDEATYAMAAESLGRDFDLEYTRADFDRFVARWGKTPDGLVLMSPDGGKHLFYSKPYLYPALAAPFELLAAGRGASFLNALLFGSALWLAYRYWARESPPLAAALLAVALGFAGVGFAYVYWIHADVLLFFLLTAALFAWLHQRTPRPAGTMPDVYEEPIEKTPSLAWHFAIAGMLLGAATFARVSAVVFFAPLLLDCVRMRRGRALAAALAGFVAVAGLLTLGQMAATGVYSSYYAPRAGFYDYTGYPLAGGPEWSQHESEQPSRWGQRAAIPVKWNPRLFAWDALYYVAGRNTGVLLYFPVAVVLLLLWIVRGPHDPPRLMLGCAIAGTIALYLLIRPHNYFGGGGSIGNRYFVGIYPAFLFLVPQLRSILPAILAVAIAAPFVAGVWRHPRHAPSAENGGYAYVTGLARELPYETTQSHIPGGRDLHHHGLWMRFLDDAVEVDGKRLRLRTGTEAEFLIGYGRPLLPLDWTFSGGAIRDLHIAVGNAENLIKLPDKSGSQGAVRAARSLPGKPSRRHPMWWTEDDFYLYRVLLRADADREWVNFEVRQAENRIESRGRVRILEGNVLSNEGADDASP